VKFILFYTMFNNYFPFFSLFFTTGGDTAARQDLPEIIGQYRLTGIVVTALLTPESRAVILELAVQYGLEISEWHCEECKMDDTPPPKDFPHNYLKPAGGSDVVATVPAVINHRII